MAPYSSLIFSHIPKCGGTSMRELLYNSASNSGICDENIYIPGYNGLKIDRNPIQLNSFQLKAFHKLEIKVAGMHVPYNSHKTYPSFGYNPLYFTLFREPFERFLSHYYFFYYRQGANGCKGTHLSDLPTEKRTMLIYNLSNLYASYIMGDVKSGLYDDVNLLTQLKSSLSNSNYVYGLLSDVTTALDNLSSQLPSWISIIADLPKVNVHNFSSTYENEISDEFREEFNRFNELDLRLYDHIVESLSI